ncbi:MAG: ATP phosphoribosyltransferase regulatory subunit [Clostridia bacterium]|nr:ATP phosphoribosyltransferase regulatory subunit [Clostridia bacterium]
MKTTPVKGTNDYLPNQAELRDLLQSKILQTYKQQGFNRIYTTILEDVENLEKSDGGDNLNLIFKVLKRGDKLTSALENKDYNNLADLGLRYDLTLPLTRFYSNNKANLPAVFKCIQIDKVYRAERPQKGRDREFVQCDIDILGSTNPNCEVELIDTTAMALLNIGLSNFKIRINDRRILKQLLLSFGFLPEQLDSTCISFDKMDKIGADGIKLELTEKSFNPESIEKLCELVSNLPISLEKLSSLCGEMQEIEQLKYIISSVKSLAEDKYDIEFDISLVRGQGYYTGAVFEIQSKDFSCSIGGGGRYDNLVGKFTGSPVPAVGFSIGFERIYSILTAKNYINENQKQKVAILYNQTNFVEAMKFSKTLKENYDIALFEMPNKLGKFLNKLVELGFTNYCVFEQGTEIKELKAF